MRGGGGGGGDGLPKNKSIYTFCLLSGENALRINTAPSMGPKTLFV